MTQYDIFMWITHIEKIHIFQGLLIFITLSFLSVFISRSPNKRICNICASRKMFVSSSAEWQEWRRLHWQGREKVRTKRKSNDIKIDAYTCSNFFFSYRFTPSKKKSNFKLKSFIQRICTETTTYLSLFFYFHILFDFWLLFFLFQFSCDTKRNELSN